MIRKLFLAVFVSGLSLAGVAQDTTAFAWHLTSKRISPFTYELHFSTRISKGWQLYGPGQNIAGVGSAEMVFPDSLIAVDTAVKRSANQKVITSKIFDNGKFGVFEDSANFVYTIR